MASVGKVSSVVCRAAMSNEEEDRELTAVKASKRKAMDDMLKTGRILVKEHIYYLRYPRPFSLCLPVCLSCRHLFRRPFRLGYRLRSKNDRNNRNSCTCLWNKNNSPCKIYIPACRHYRAAARRGYGRTSRRSKYPPSKCGSATRTRRCKP